MTNNKDMICRNQDGFSDVNQYRMLSYQDTPLFKTMNSNRRPSTDHFIDRGNNKNHQPKLMLTDMANQQSLVKFGNFFSSRNKADKRATSIQSTRSKSNTKYP